MTEAHLHAHALHLGQYGTTEGGQPGVVRLAATPHAVGDVVGQQHPAHTQVVITLDEAELVADGIGPLDVKTHRQPARGPRPIEVFRLKQQQVLVGSCQQPIAQCNQHAQVVLGPLLSETDVHGDGVEAGGLVTRQLRQKGAVLRPQRHAGVVIPHGHGIDELSCTGDGGFGHAGWGW